MAYWKQMEFCHLVFNVILKIYPLAISRRHHKYQTEGIDRLIYMYMMFGNRLYKPMFTKWTICLMDIILRGIISNKTI